MGDVELEYGSDQEVSANHSQLLEAVSQLDKGQRVKKPLRSEPSLEVSEFHLVKSGVTKNNAVHLLDLAKTLRKRANHVDISKKLKATQKKLKVLRKPLEKHVAARIKRTVGFENTKRDLGRWDAIVAKNRTAEQLKFPLNQSNMKLQTSNQYVERFRLQTDLEKELAALEPKKEEVIEVKEKSQMSKEEITERRKEAAKLRAQQSYKEAKAHRQNKIKSKKFHRIQRKEKIKKQLKDFEELQKTDPEAALAKLEQLDKTRAEERMSLRHRSTGQWAKNLQVRAKYDKDSRQVLAQQLSISRELTQKIQTGDESEDDEEVVLPVSATDKDNPWVNGKRTQSEIDDFISGYRKYWDERNKLEKPKEQREKEENITEQKKQERTEETLVVPHVKDLPKALNPVEEVIVECPELMFDDSEDDNTNIQENGVSAGSDESEKESPEPTVSKKRKIDTSLCSQKLNTGTSPVNVQSESVKSEKRNGKDSETLRKGERVNKSRKSPLSKSSRTTEKNRIAETVGTTGWSVSPVGMNGTEDACRPSKSLEIDEIFDTMEDQIQEKIDLKLKNIKGKYRIKLDVDKKLTDNDKESEDEYTGDLSFKNKPNRPVIDEQMDEVPGRGGTEISREIEKLKKLANADIHALSESHFKGAEIDPNKFINVKPKHLKTLLPDVITGGDEALDDSEGEEDRHMTISEAFADDDVVNEFRKEKEDEVKSGIPENIDLTLPGWGSWGGKNVAVSKRKKRRFIMKFPKDRPRRDENKGDVIIIEEKDPKIKEHQVSELPFPFTSVKDFEASIRAPIGRTFIPENAHRKLIEPAVTSKLGKVIEPMDEESLVNVKKSKNDRKPVINKRRKKKNAKK